MCRCAKNVSSLIIWFRIFMWEGADRGTGINKSTIFLFLLYLLFLVMLRKLMKFDVRIRAEATQPKTRKLQQVC